MLRQSAAALSESTYAAELRQSSRHFRFTSALEREYSNEYLSRNRTLVRIACVMSLVLSPPHLIAHAITERLSPYALAALVLATCVCVLLTFLAFSRWFDKAYLPFARILVPLRNILFAICLALAASEGRMEALIALPLLLIGPFFFLGFGFRLALICGVITLLTFATTTALVGLPLDILLHTHAVLLAVLISSSAAARHLELRSRLSFIEKRAISELAEHDALTGMKNRRAFDQQLLRLWRQSITDASPLAVMLIDVDHFKAYNDHYGHQAGDQTLREVAQHMQKHVRRPLDIVARYGGEEFAAVLYGVNAEGAAKIAEDMRRGVEALGIKHRGASAAHCVTISIGVAVLQPRPERSSRGALQLADQALYEAKLKGRNAVEVMNEDDYRMMKTGSFARSAQESHAQRLDLQH